MPPAPAFHPEVLTPVVLARGISSEIGIPPRFSKTMSDLKRKKQALEQELQRIAQEMRKVKRKHATCGHLQITAGQRTTARALMVMRDGEPTAAMTFLRAKHKGPVPIATHWADMESELREW